METHHLDEVLVPLGLALMIGYHLWLLHRVLRRPTRTVIGINAVNRRIWVRSMMEDPIKNGVLAVQTLRNNIMASTLMASTAIMLCSLIAVLMTGGRGCNDVGAAQQRLVVGITNLVGLPHKFFAILLCFLAAFFLNVQSVRYYSHASVLINVPVRCRWQQRAAPEYVARTVNWGSYCWSLGLRACYFSLPLFLWVFGPIPMVCCCFVLVVMLYFLDAYSDWEEGGGGDDEGEAEMSCMVG